MKWPHSPLFIPVLLFTLGGVLSFLIPTALALCLRLGCLFVLFLFFTQIFKFLQPIQTLCIYSCFLWAGLLYFKAYYTPSPNHYQNLKEEDAQLKQIEIQSLVGSYSFSTNYVGKVMGMGSQKTTGSVLIRQVKDSTSKVWDSGQKIFTNQNFEAIKGPLNPGQFSYKNYLANKKIYHQLSLNSANSISTASQSLSLRSYAENLERNAFKKIEASTLTSSSQAMLKALLFADRNALEDRIKKDYAHTGVIHLLALSGLHIGLLVGFLLFLLQPLKQIKYGALIQSFCIISLLWMFAFFIGFPPSVSRAVCMFSFMVIGRTLHYGKSTFHYTLLSFFVLLLCYPPYLRSVGFQLSYLAVFGILLIHPLLQKLWIPKSRLLKRYWEWTTVCLAAQLAVSPISIYYFHQFPSLFLVSNLLIIPFFGLFVMVCVTVFFVLIFFSLPSNVVTFFDLMVTLLNGTVSRIAQQEAFLFDEIFFSTNTTLLLYLILIGFVFWGYQKKMWTFIPIGALLVGLWMTLVDEQQRATAINSFWFFIDTTPPS